MSNSAISGNVQGLATAGSPGLVGTGAQTFAGKKTFDGGAAIKGDASGIGVAIGYVGEVKTATKTTTSETGSAVSGTWYDAGLSLSLEAGVWLVTASARTVTYFSAYTNGSADTFMAICTGTTASPTVVTSAICTTPPRVGETLAVTFGCQTVVTVPATTVHSVYYRMTKTGTNTLATTGLTGSTDIPMRFQAIRIA